MPFDSAPQQADDLLTFTPGREGLRKLATLLRMEMPPGFKWFFGSVCVKKECGTVGCAIGLAMTTWPELTAILPLSHDGGYFNDRDGSSVARIFDMSARDAHDIFYRPSSYSAYSLATPADVAEKIDAYLARTS